MRVALVVTGGVDSSGRDRVIPVLLTLVERLARQHRVVVYALRYLSTPTTYPLLGATVCDLGSPSGIRAQYAALVGALRRDGPFDVVHGHWALPSGLVAALAGRRLGIAAVVTLDSGEFVGLPEIGYGAQLHLRQRLAVRAAYTLASDAIVCTSYQARLAGRLGMRPSIVPLGVDLGLFTPASGPASPSDGPPWRLLHVGSINPVKDHETLLRALQRLRARHLEVSLDVVGEDRREGAMAQLVAQLGLESCVTFHGVIASPALVPFYQNAHLLVVTSRHEAAGMVVLEAAACGLPVVGSDVGHIADWAPRRATAVAAKNPAALADAIALLLADPARRAETAEAALEWTRAHDADWTATELTKRYEIAAGRQLHRQDDRP